MKYTTSCIILLIISIYIRAGEPLRIGIISDTHYLSEQLMDDGYATENYIYTTARDIRNVPLLLDSVFTDFLDNNIQILLISGDITKDGEMQSHTDFANKLGYLQEKGIRTFVIPGNHDIERNSKRFTGNKSFDTETISPAQFAEIYGKFGYNDALKRDAASLSYLASLDDNTWLLAIDIARDKQYKKEGLPSEALSEQTEEWIINILKEAKDKQIQVIGMMHWGLVEHLPYQSRLFPKYLINDWQRLAGLFADNGMEIIFTGHFHSNDISAFTSDTGNMIYDIETGPLCCYPFVYRFAELTGSGINITTKRIGSLAQAPSLAEQNRALLKQVAEKTAIPKIKSFGFDADTAALKKMSDVISGIFLIHVAGDEVIDSDLMSEIKQLSVLLGTSTEDELDIPDLDFFPADNNVYIEF